MARYMHIKVNEYHSSKAQGKSVIIPSKTNLISCSIDLSIPSKADGPKSQRVLAFFNISMAFLPMRSVSSQASK